MLSVQTPAKVNLFLNIRGRRPDGFHEICSVMQAVQLWDRLDVSPKTEQRRDIQFSCNLPALEQSADRNLVVRAYHTFWQATQLPPLGLHVHLEKNIPLQAGLGGGSSDAAAMLHILNHLSHAGLSDDDLRQLGAELGSDVPFFIAGGSALITGRGEVVQPLPAHLTAALPLVIIKPLGLNIETATAYRRFAEQGRYEQHAPDHILGAMRNLQQRRRPTEAIPLESYLRNDFESVLFTEAPLLGQMAQRMRQLGIRRPLLSGSGSAMLGFVPDASFSMKTAIQQAFPRQQFEVHWTQTHTGSLVQVPNPVPVSLDA